MAKELGVSVEELMACFRAKPAAGAPGAVHEPSPGYDGRYLPVVGVITGPTFHLDIFGPASEVLALPAGRHFALRVSGNALAPLVKDGQYLLAVPAANIPPDMPGIYHAGKDCVIRGPGAGGSLKPMAIVLGGFFKPGR